MKNIHGNFGLVIYFHVPNVKLGGKVRKKIWHTGNIPGFLSCSEVFPNEDIQIVMITNISSKNFGHNCSNVESIVFEYIQ